jgi:hypothetical protein
MSVLLFNDGPDVQIVLHVLVKLGSWHWQLAVVWSGGSVLGLQPSS